MSFTQSLVYSVAMKDGGGANTRFNWTESNTQAGLISVSEVIPDASTDLLVAFAVDVSEIKSIVMWCDNECTVETNSGSVADETFNLLAGVPMIWNANMLEPNPWATDVTALYITTASVGASAFEIRCVYDPTV